MTADTSATAISRLRTWLYVPGHRSRVLQGADGRGADAVIADLEDAVPPAAHDEARALVTRWLAAPSTIPRWIRVGAAHLEDDLASVVQRSLSGIVLAKAEPDLLEVLDARLAGAERERGMPVGSVPVVALLETAIGILDARLIATMPRVASLAIGEADLAAELRITPSPDERELVTVRTQVVLAASAAGLCAPMAPVCTEFRDLERLHQVTSGVARQGFGAFAAIHPAQLPVLRRALEPDAEEVAHARAVLDAVRDAGGAAAVGPDGRMVDEAVARRAREVLERAGR